MKVGGSVAANNVATTDNLYFAKYSGDNTQIPTSKADAIVTPLPTIYYALPNAMGTSPVDDGSGESISANTGFTCHVSYNLRSVDSDEILPIYDARVFVPASSCRWEAGKSYLYVFKVTSNSNGVLNPVKADPTATSTPYVDEHDPRISSDPAVSPIIFDELVVYEYDGTVSDLQTHDGVQLWADGPIFSKTNLGADTETDYGSYFKWGSLYEFVSIDPANVECILLDYDINNTEYDVAKAYWGDGWQLPTKEDFENLINNTTHEFVTDYNGSGVSGLLFTGKGDYSSNTIFMPAGGFLDVNKNNVIEINCQNGLCDYWSGTGAESESAYSLWYEDGDKYGLKIFEDGARADGCLIRPVKKATTSQ